MSRSLANSVVLSLVDRHLDAELAGHAPGPGDAVAETIDEGIHDIGVIDASVVGAVDGAQLVDTAVLV